MGGPDGRSGEGEQLPFDRLRRQRCAEGIAEKARPGAGREDHGVRGQVAISEADPGHAAVSVSDRRHGRLGQHDRPGLLRRRREGEGQAVDGEGADTAGQPGGDEGWWHGGFELPRGGGRQLVDGVSPVPLPGDNRPGGVRVRLVDGDGELTGTAVLDADPGPRFQLRDQRRIALQTPHVERDPFLAPVGAARQ